MSPAQHGCAIVKPFRAWYTGTDQLDEGYCLCYDQDSGVAASVDHARLFNVEKPSTTNCHGFAGVVTKKPATVGPCYVDMAPPGSEVNVYALVNATVDVTRMTVMAGQYYMYTEGFEGAGSARCLQTVNNSAAAGLIQALLDVGPQSGGVELIVPTNVLMTPMVTGVTFFDACDIAVGNATATLADGTHIGQRKAFFCEGAMTTSDIVVTVTTNFAGAGSDVYTMDAAAEYLYARWNGKAWATEGAAAS